MLPAGGECFRASREEECYTLIWKYDRSGSSLPVRLQGWDACLFVFVGVCGGSAVTSSGGTVGGGGRGDGDLLLVVDETVVVREH